MNTNDIIIAKHEIDNDEHNIKFDVAVLAKHLTMKQLKVLISIFSNHLIVHNYASDEIDISVCFNGAAIQINNPIDESIFIDVGVA